MTGEQGGYHIQHELKPGVTWLALDDTQRPLVLKRLPGDCLRQGRLHPSVRDRLERFRELPLISFAAFIGVERVGGHVVSVSEYVDGVPLGELSQAARIDALRSLRDGIGALHNLGLVHGGLHGGNVIVDRRGAVRVLDPSPLLHDDPADDLSALDALDPPPAPRAVPAPLDEDAPIRRRNVVAAAILAGFGIIAAVALGIVGSRL